MATPTDPLYNEQWHFPLIGNVEAIWDDYDGTGVTVVVYDEGVEYDHPDLAANYDATMHFTYQGITYDPMPIDGNSGHGTSCAGLIGAAANNGIGGTGVAYGVTLTGVNYLDDLQFATPDVYDACMLWAANFDIMSNSWGSTPTFSPNLNMNVAGSFTAIDVALYEMIAETGRDGLGTIIVQAAGNETRNANGSGINTSRHSISVSATDDQGKATDYTNYGAAILIAAPASGVTTDLTGNDGYNDATDADPVPTDYTSTFNGTSAATPTVAGVIALMLDAAPGLGWRDVNEILALSASHTGSALGGPGTGFEVGGWQLMNGNQWNGGGTMYHSSYGYGMVDAYAAVRMAEVWLRMSLSAGAQTSANELTVKANYNGGTVGIPENNGVAGTGAAKVNVVSGSAIEIDPIYVSISLTHANAHDLKMFLVAPDGTRIALYNQDGNSRLMDSGLVWTFAVEALRGYSSAGTWTVEVEDVVTGSTGSIQDVEIEFFGGSASINDVFTFTNDFLALAALESSRKIIDDTNGGIDWLNFVAVSGNINVSMATGGQIKVNGVLWATNANGTADFEKLSAGDGNDSILGNTLNNEILGGRGNDTIKGNVGADVLEGQGETDLLNGEDGNDTLRGGDGNDSLTGGLGNDVLAAGNGNDSFIFVGKFGTDRLVDFKDNIDTLRFDDAIWGGGKTVAQVISAFARVIGADTVFDFGGGNKVTVVGVTNLAVFQDDILII